MTGRTVPVWPDKQPLFGVGISATDYNEAADVITTAAHRREGGLATALAVHGLMTAHGDSAYCEIINGFDLVAPDGQPVRHALNLLHNCGLTSRVYGPELMLRLCHRAAEQGVGIYLYGSKQHVVETLACNLRQKFPALVLAGAEPSLFRPLSAEEDEALVWRINASGAGLLFVGLGCPLQEAFAWAHRRTINAVQVCVGAAFDFHSGNKHMAPRWMQELSMEWMYRLMQEPQRLCRRYLVTNSLFLWKLANELARGRRLRVGRAGQMTTP